MLKQPDNIERRLFAVEIRKAPEGTRKIQGYAAVFNKLSDDLGYFREKIDPGAFKKTLKESDVRAFWNHNTDFILGRSKAKTLTLDEDDKGLAFQIDPPETTYANDLLISMARGDVDQMSFGFRTIRDQWEYNRSTDEVTRTLLEVALIEVSPVSIPAYPQTSAAVSSRAIEQAAETRSKFSTIAPAGVTAPVIDHAAESQRRMRLELAKRGLQLA